MAQTPQLFVALALLLSFVVSQQAGNLIVENHPPLSWQTCSNNGCTTHQGSIVLDADWRWVHTTDGYTNCYTGNEWNTTICPDPVTCATVSLALYIIVQ